MPGHGAPVTAVDEGREITAGKTVTEIGFADIADGLVALRWLSETTRTLALGQPYADLIGYLNPLRSTMIQVVDQIGLEWLYRQKDSDLRLSPVFDRDNSMAIIMCLDQQPNPTVLEICRSHGIALVRTAMSGEAVTSYLQRRLPKLLSPRCNKHGVFVAVMNTGVLITGASGVGKSEVALDLVQRGHQLIADDAVILQRRSDSTLSGSCAPSLKGYLEIRGLGIINIEKMFGPSAVLDAYPLQLIINLKDATNREIRSLDRLHPSLELLEILGVSVPRLGMLVAPGRNLSVLVEAATRDHLLRRSGVDSSLEFLSRHDEIMGIGDVPARTRQER